MPKDKTQITTTHIKGIQKALRFFKSQSEMARYLGIRPSNVSMWAIGMQVIPPQQAYRLTSNFDITMEELRPDLKNFFQKK